jgi:phage virion morphogenesis protein
MIVVDMTQLEQTIRRILMVLASQPSANLLDAIGAVVESQTRDRIQNQKASPEGDPWPAWSEAYAATRGAGQSLLQSEGFLLDSIDAIPKSSAVEVGSSLVYAKRQQLGDGGGDDDGIPAREYLGLSDDNEKDVLLSIGEFLEREIARR